MLIDTHCHIHHPGYFEDPDAEVALAREAGVERIVVIGVDPEDWPRARDFAERHEGVTFAAAWHPNATADYDPADLDDLHSFLMHPKCVALGETGLDYHHAFAPREAQHEALRDALHLATTTGKPVVFHAREAYGDLLDILEARPPHPCLFHCFVGNNDEARRAIDLGALFGLDGPVTYPKSVALRETFARIPLDRIVLETDAPYLAPAPHRGKPNRPAYIPILAAKLAELHGVDVDEVARVTTANALAFFRMD